MLKFFGGIGTVCGAIIAAGVVWHMIGGDTPAWSSDIKRLDRGQAAFAVDEYSKAIRDDMILKEQIKDPMTKVLIDQRLDEYREKLKAARDRAIQLSK